MQQSILEIKRRLARLLVEKSYREGDFVLASGRRSDYYFDCRVTALHAEGSWLIGTLFNDLLKDVPVVGVGGMTMGADPLVSATTAISHELGRPLNGLLVRNGTVYRNNPTTQDICVLYQDGTMATYSPNQFDPQAALEQGILQTWIFGPRLLDDRGKALKTFDPWGYIKKIHPRTALGYYEPGHYCFVVVDGRQSGYSRGMSLPELAQVFEDLGCTAAYNMDGGHTVFMTKEDQYVNHSYKPSKTISDCICICEPTEEASA